jgi:hypothetical protein
MMRGEWRDTASSSMASITASGTKPWGMFKKEMKDMRDGRDDRGGKMREWKNMMASGTASMTKPFINATMTASMTQKFIDVKAQMEAAATNNPEQKSFIKKVFSWFNF